MPNNLVKPGQEKQWDQAKSAAAKEGKAQDHALITGIFERILAHVGSGKLPPVNKKPGHEPIMDQLADAAKKRKGKKPDDEAKDSEILRKA